MGGSVRRVMAQRSRMVNEMLHELVLPVCVLRPEDHAML